MNTTAGTGAMLCAHCGRPMVSSVWIGGRAYHEECTRGPGYTQQFYTAPTSYPWQMPAEVTEKRVREIVREELVKLELLDARDPR